MWSNRFLILIFLVFQVFVISSFANTNHKAIGSNFFIGHNLTTSTETPKKSLWTVGNYALGYAVTDDIMLATSPWILTSYNSHNYHLKWTKSISSTERIGVFLSYFESINTTAFMTVRKGAPQVLDSGTSVQQDYFKLNRYQWKSVSTNFLYGVQQANSESLFLNFKYSYYINDDYPFSLRMDPGDEKRRGQIDISSLIKWDEPKENFSWAFEMGVLGLNYVSPFLHTGASIMFYDENWSMQIGASFTAMFNELLSARAYQVGRLDDRAHYSSTENQYYSYRYYQSAVHPEIQIQYSF
jgi:hypothetical protein